MTRTATIALICLVIIPTVVEGADKPLADFATQSLLVAAISNESTPDDPAVESARDALSGRPRYPWYDAENDAIERIDVKPPEVGFWDWFWDLFPEWDWDWGGSGSGSGSGLATFFRVLVFGLIAVVSLVLVFFLVRAFIKQEEFVPAHGTGGSVDDEAEGRRRIEALPFQLAADMSNLLDAARHYRDQGEFGEAVKYLFSYQLVQLDRYHLIRMTRGKTNRQYLRELGRGHNLRTDVEDTMKVFEESFFGNRVIRRPRFEACWSRVENFDSHLASLRGNGQNQT